MVMTVAVHVTAIVWIGPSVVPTIVVVAVTNVVVRMSFMAMSAVTRQAPNSKPDTGENEHDANNMPLLGLEGRTELKTDQRDDPAEDDRGQDVPHRGQQTDACRVNDTPPLCPGHDRQRDPVIRQDRVEKPDCAGGDE